MVTKKKSLFRFLFHTQHQHWIPDTDEESCQNSTDRRRLKHPRSTTSARTSCRFTWQDPESLGRVSGEGEGVFSKILLRGRRRPAGDNWQQQEHSKAAKTFQEDVCRCCCYCAEWRGGRGHGFKFQGRRRGIKQTLFQMAAILILLWLQPYQPLSGVDKTLGGPWCRPLPTGGQFSENSAQHCCQPV